MTRRTRSIVLSTFALAPLALATPAADDVFKPGDYEAIGKKIAEFMKAAGANQSLDKPLEEVQKELDKVQKRLNKNPLALPAEMGKCLWAAFGYDKKSAGAKGKVATGDLPAYWEPKGKLPYAYWVPQKYDGKTPYPLILCVPDKGEKPSDHLSEKWMGEQEMKDKVVLAAISMPDDVAAWTEDITSEKETGSGNVVTLLTYLTRNYAIDPDRIFLAGSGRGVEVVSLYGSRFGDKLAGVIGRSGDPVEVKVENLKLLPTFFAGGGAKATAIQEKSKALGYDNATLVPEGKEKDIWTWMQSHPRNPNPTEVVIYPGVTVPKRTYWLEVVPNDAKDPYVKAKVDRATNTITIDAEGTTQVILSFNDVLVDLDKPVKVVRNGQEKTDTIQRNLKTTLNLVLSSRNDAAKFYVNTMQYDVPAKPKQK